LKNINSIVKKVVIAGVIANALISVVLFTLIQLNMVELVVK
jgi:hypothetical protein